MQMLAGYKVIVRLDSFFTVSVQIDNGFILQSEDNEQKWSRKRIEYQVI